jgi:hypothetical protein
MKSLYSAGGPGLQAFRLSSLPAFYLIQTVLKLLEVETWIGDNILYSIALIVFDQNYKFFTTWPTASTAASGLESNVQLTTDNRLLCAFFHLK